MIAFKALMQAIHQSIHSAAQAVENEGIKHIEKFFDPIPNEDYEESEEHDTKLKEAQEFLANGDIQSATKHLGDIENGKVNNKKFGPEGKTTHRPKMVAMAFPNQTPNGVESVVVNVPLITLSPISSPRVKEVKLTADLEVTTDENNELFIAFQSTKKRGFLQGDENRSNTNTHIEITLQGGEAPEGLQKIIEGYEKALRAQIPG